MKFWLDFDSWYRVYWLGRLIKIMPLRRWAAEKMTKVLKMADQNVSHWAKMFRAASAVNKQNIADICSRRLVVLLR